MAKMIYQNRLDAARELGRSLSVWAGQPDALLVALPRGGVPIGLELAGILHLPLEVLVVCKICLQEAEPLVVGAIARGEVPALNQDLIRSRHLSAASLAQAELHAHKELQYWDRLYRQEQPVAVLAGKTAILIDDGIASSEKMRAAVLSLRRGKPARIVIAAPIASSDALTELRPLADELVILTVPDPFVSVAACYRDHPPLSDEALCAQLSTSDTYIKPRSYQI